jgi:hypothetical protein
LGEIQSDCKTKILPIFLATNGNEKKRSGNFYFSDVWLLKTLKITSFSFSFFFSNFSFWRNFGQLKKKADTQQCFFFQFFDAAQSGNHP